MNRLVQAATVAVFLLLVSVTAGAGVDRAAAVLEHARAAHGGGAWDAVKTLHVSGVVATAGLEGPFEAHEDVLTGRFRDDFDLGATKGANGFDGKVAWSQDASGQSLEQEGPQERQAALNDAFRRARAYWYPSRRAGKVEYLDRRSDERGSFDVLQVTPEGTRGFELWVDAGSGRIDRTVERIEPEVFTSYFSDYRETAGLVLPHSIRITNGKEKYDQRLTVIGYEVNAPVADALFAMPPPPPRDFGIAGGAKSTEVPFELVNNHIYADVRIDGRGPFRLLVDTGGMNIVTPALAQELGLESQGALEGRGVGQKSEDVGITKVKRLEIGAAHLDDQVFYVFPLDAMSAVEGIPVRGLVGYEVFKRFVSRIDYERGRLTLFDPEGWTYAGSGTVLPFVFAGNIPQVDGAIDEIPGKFDLDTGSRSSVDLMTQFVREHGIAEQHPDAKERIVGYGVGGPTRGRMIAGRELRLGPVVIPGLYAGISSATKGAFAVEGVAGNVGGDVLKRFNVVLDYGRKQVVLEKNANFSRPATYDRSGLWLHLGDGAWEVVEVVAGMPGEAAGLRAGDRILQVDGRTPSELSLNDLRMRLREAPAGTKVRLKLADGERTLVL